MSRPQQTKVDRIQRLSQSRCPIHGIKMRMTGRARLFDGELEPEFSCPRGACNVIAWISEVNGNTVTSPASLEGMHTPPGSSLLDLLAIATEDDDDG